MNDTDDKVIPLGVRYSGPDDVANPPVLKLAPRGDHPCAFAHKGPYLVDDKLAEVECGTCHALLNPMFVLRELAHKEHQWHDYRRIYHEQCARLAERQRTKCDHCGHLTRISSR